MDTKKYQKKHNGIILLSQQINEIDHEDNSLQIADEIKLKAKLAKIGFSTSLEKLEEELAQGVKPVNKKLIGAISILGALWFLFCQALFFSGEIKDINIITLLLIATSFGAIGVLVFYIAPTIRFKEISVEQYEKVAVVAKYNPEVYAFVKKTLKDSPEILICEYSYMNIERQYYVIHTSNADLIEKKKAIIKEFV